MGGGIEKGRARSWPGIFLISGLAACGLPGLSPFVSEMLVLIAAFSHAWWAGAIAVTAIVLAAVYVLWLYQRTMTGPASRWRSSGPRPREVGTLAPLLLALVLFGFFPMPLLDVINRNVTDTMSNVGVTDDPPTDHRRGQLAGRPRVTEFIKPTIEYFELFPLLVVFGVACLGVVVEAFAPRCGPLRRPGAAGPRRSRSRRWWASC